MKQVVKYIAVDPYYSDQCHEYIGETAEEVDNIRMETEDYMRGEHCSLSMVYKTEIVYDSTCEF